MRFKFRGTVNGNMFSGAHSSVHYKQRLYACTVRCTIIGTLDKDQKKTKQIELYCMLKKLNKIEIIFYTNTTAQRNIFCLTSNTFSPSDVFNTSPFEYNGTEPFFLKCIRLENTLGGIIDH